MVTPPALRALSGRIFFRHSSGMGSVMIFNDRGTWRKVLILDAKYRTKKQFGLYRIEPPEFQNSQLEEPNAFWLNYPMERSTEVPDSWISENIAWDPMTSRERCDVWMKYKYVKDRMNPPILGCPAVEYCRNIEVNGTPCDLPNIQTLVRIYVDRNTIDQMDPTVEEYSERCLKKWNFGSAPVSWSSSGHSSSLGCWGVLYNGGVSCYGKFKEFSVVPILEL